MKTILYFQICILAYFISNLTQATEHSMFNVIEGFVVEDQNLDPWSGGCFVKPNERAPEFFKRIVKNKHGILISVGTLRSFITFANGSFSHLIMMDIDPNVREFNRQVLRELHRLAASYPDDFETQRHEFQMHNRFYTEVFGRGLFWDNNEDWKRLINAVLEHRIFVIDGDFSSPDKNIVLKQALQSESLLDLPRTFDISNVLDYIPYRFHENFVSSLEALSRREINKDDLVLMTHSYIFDMAARNIPFSYYPKRLGEADPWTYYFSKLSIFSLFNRAALGYPDKEKKKSKSKSKPKPKPKPKHSKYL